MAIDTVLEREGREGRGGHKIHYNTTNSLIMSAIYIQVTAEHFEHNFVSCPKKYWPALRL